MVVSVEAETCDHQRLCLKSRLPVFRCHWLNEDIGADTGFADCTSVRVFACFQLFMGIDSQTVWMHPLSSERMKHINIQHFFITDRIDKGEVSVVWCPAGNMTRDFMTKPLQGAPFCKFRDHVVGVVPTQDPGPGKVVEPKVVKKTKSDKKNDVKKKKSRGKATDKLVVHKKQ